MNALWCRVLLGGLLAPLVAAGPLSVASHAAATHRPPLAPGTYVRYVSVDGRVREYLLHVPAHYRGAQPLPVIFAFHGSSASAGVLERETSLDERADAQHFFVVYPQGLRRAWNIGECCYYAFTHGVSETNFVKAMLDRLRATVAVDTSRIYATGYSDGGTLSYLLACALPDRIAAVAAISATLFDPLPPCSLPHPVPVMIVHGTGDQQIPYQGRPGGPASSRRPSLYHSVSDVTRFWLDRDRCYTAPEQMRSGRVLRVHYRCADSAEVLLYTILGGKHGWPGGGRGWVFSPRPPQDMVASDTVVRFFLRHHLPVTAVELRSPVGVRSSGGAARSGQSPRRPPAQLTSLRRPQQPGPSPGGGAKTAS